MGWIGRLSPASLLTLGAASWNPPPDPLSLRMRKDGAKGLLQEGIWGVQKHRHTHHSLDIARR